MCVCVCVCKFFTIILIDVYSLRFLEDQDISLVSLGMEGRRKSWNPIAEEAVLTGLDLILDPANYPLYIMCQGGTHRTGALVGCLRKIQRWNLTSIFEEYRRYTGSKVRLLNEQFIELFDTDLVRMPENPPRWL